MAFNQLLTGWGTFMTSSLTATQHRSLLGKLFKLDHGARLLGAMAVACLTATQAQAVDWDADGDGVSWFDSANWTGDVLPGSSDLARLITGQTTPVVFTGSNATIMELIATQPLSLEGNTLTVTNGAEALRTLTLNGGSFSSGGGLNVGTVGEPFNVNTQAHLELLDGSISGDVVLNLAILTIGDTWTNTNNNTFEAIIRGHSGQLNGNLAANHVLALQGRDENFGSWAEVFWKSGFTNNGTIIMTSDGANPNGVNLIIDNDGNLVNNNLISVLAGDGSLRSIAGANRLTNAPGAELRVEEGTFLTLSGVNEGSTNSPNWNHLTYEAAGGTISERAYFLHSEVDISASTLADQTINLVGPDNRLLSDNLTGYTLNIQGTAIPGGSAATDTFAFSHALVTLRNDDDPATAKTFTNAGTIVLDDGHVTPASNALPLGSANLDIGIHHLTNTGDIEVGLGSGTLRAIRGRTDGTQGIFENATGGSIQVEDDAILFISGTNVNEGGAPDWRPIKYIGSGGTVDGKVVVMRADLEFTADAPASESILNLVTFDNRLTGTTIAANNTLRILGTEIIPPAPALEPPDAFGHAVLTLMSSDLTNHGKIVLDSEDLDDSTVPTAGTATSTFAIGLNTFVNQGTVEARPGTGTLRTIRGTQTQLGTDQGIFENAGEVVAQPGAQLIISGTNANEGGVPDWRPIKYIGAGGTVSGDVLVMHTDLEFTADAPASESVLNIVTPDNRLEGTTIAANNTLRILGTEILPSMGPEPADAYGHAVLTQTSANVTNNGKIVLDSDDLDESTMPANGTGTATLDLGSNSMTNAGTIEAVLGTGTLRTIKANQGVLQNTGEIIVEADAQLIISGTNLNEGGVPDWRPINYIGAGGTVSGDVLVMHADLEFTADAPASESTLNLVTFDNRLEGTTIAANNTLRVLGTELVPTSGPEPADAYGHAVLTQTSANVTNNGKIVLDSEDLDLATVPANGIGTATLDLGSNSMTNAGTIEALLGTGTLRTIRGNQGVLQNTGEIIVDAGAQLIISGTNLNEGGAPNWSPIKYLGAGGTVAGDVLVMHADLEFTADTPASESVLNIVTPDNRLMGSTIAANNTLRILGTEILPSSGPEPADAFGHSLLTVQTPTITNNGKVVFDSEDLDDSAQNPNGVGTANLDIGSNTFINAGEIEVTHTTGSLRELRGFSNGEFRHEGLITVADGALFKISGGDLNQGSPPPAFDRIKFVANGGSTDGQVFLARSDIHINAAPTTGELVLNIGTFDNVLRTNNVNGSTLRIVGTDLPGAPERPDQMANGVLSALNPNGTTLNHGNIVLTSMDIDPAVTVGIGAAVLDVGFDVDFSSPTFDTYKSSYQFINESDGVIQVEAGPVTDDPVPGARSARIIQGTGTLTNRGLIDVETNAILRISGVRVGNNWSPLTYVAEDAGTTAGNAFLTHTLANVGDAVTGGGQRVTNFATPDNVVTSDNPANSTLRIVGTELIEAVAFPEEPADALGHGLLFFAQQDTVNTGNIILDAQDLEPTSNITEVGSSNLSLDLKDDEGNGQNRTFTNEGQIEALAGTLNGSAPSLREVRGSGQLINRGMIKATDPGDTGLYLTLSGINTGQQGAPNWEPLQFHAENGGTTSGDVVLTHSQINIANDLASPSVVKIAGNDNTLMTDNHANSTIVVQGAGTAQNPDPFANAFGSAALTLNDSAATVRNFGTIVLTDGHLGADLPDMGAAAIDLGDNHELINETTGVIEAQAGTAQSDRLILGGATNSFVNKGQVIAPTGSDQVLFVEVNTTSEGGSFSGNLDFATSVELDNGSTMQLQIGGLTPQSGHDQVNVTQNVTLAGELDLGLTGGFRPNYGDTFDILTYGGTRTGTFDTVLGGVVDNDLALATIYDYVDQDGTRNGITLVATGPGDVNLDFEVNIFDLSIIVGNINQTGTWSEGDINGDGNVDIFDISIVVGNINRDFTPPPGSPIAGLQNVAVPEPGTFALFGGILIAATSRLRYSRTRSNPYRCV